MLCLRLHLSLCAFNLAWSCVVHRRRLLRLLCFSTLRAGFPFGSKAAEVDDAVAESRRVQSQFGARRTTDQLSRALTVKAGAMILHQGH